MNAARAINLLFAAYVINGSVDSHLENPGALAGLAARLAATLPIHAPSAMPEGARGTTIAVEPDAKRLVEKATKSLCSFRGDGINC